MSKGNRGFFSRLFRLSVTLSLAVLPFFLALIGYEAWLYNHSPAWTLDKKEVAKKLSSDTLILTADGKTFGVFFEKTHRESLTFEQIPPLYVKAIVASEDANFWTHYGVDPMGLFRAVGRSLYNKATAKGPVVGGSTIEQQVAKKFTEREGRSITAKLAEIPYAIALDQRFSKQEILELYVNMFHVSSNIEGLTMAARYVFSKDVNSLNLGETAFLAGFVKGPSNYLPFDKPAEKAARAIERAEIRKAYVLGRMLEEGFITKPQYDTALAEKLAFNKGEVKYERSAVIDTVAKQVESGWLADALREAGVDLSQGGYRIITSIDFELQTAARNAMEKRIEKLGGEIQGAAIVLQQGYIRALMPGAGGDDNYLNRAVDRVRQLGSIWKLVLYAAAKTLGWTTTSELDNGPQTFWWRGQSYSPENSHKDAPVKVTMHDAVVESHNRGAVSAAYHLLDRTNGQRFDEILKHQGVPPVDANDPKDQKFLTLVRDTLALRPTERSLKQGIFSAQRVELAERLNSEGRLAEEQNLYALTYDEFVSGMSATQLWAANAGEELQSDPLAALLAGVTEAATAPEAPTPQPESLPSPAIAQEAGPSPAPDAAQAAPVVGGDPVAELRSLVDAEYARLSVLPKFSRERITHDMEFRVAVGLQYIIDFAKAMGVTSELELALSLPLGAKEISLLEATVMYQTLQDGMVYEFPNGARTAIVTEVQDRGGNTLWKMPAPTPRRLLDESIPPALGQMMMGVIENEHGTGHRFHNTVKCAETEVPFGGKTGTTNDNLNIAFLGFVPALAPDQASVSYGRSLTIGVYLGYDMPRTIVENVGSKKKPRWIRLDGAGGTLPVWTAIANAIVNSPAWGKPSADTLSVTWQEGHTEYNEEIVHTVFSK